MPCDYSKYHPKWSLIKRLILRRAEGRCEQCGAIDESVGYWIDNQFWPLERFEADRLGPAANKKPWKVALAIAHLDHDITRNRFWNLMALCQACHLAHDRVDNADRRRYGPHGRHFNQVKLQFDAKLHHKNRRG